MRSKLGQVKPKTIQLVLAASPLSTHYYGIRSKTGSLGSCPIEVICPLADVVSVFRFQAN